jgi:Mn-dependent DtxR family transcriptional regulator
MEHLTIAMEHYLETVYDLCGEGGCRLSDVAARLEVSKASANNAMNVLASRGLVESEKYREIRLTEQGLRLAELLSTSTPFCSASDPGDGGGPGAGL